MNWEAVIWIGLVMAVWFCAGFVWAHVLAAVLKTWRDRRP